MIEIAIIEDDVQLLTHLKKLINEQVEFNCSITESRIGNFFEQLQLDRPPDILVLDIFLKNRSNFDHLQKLKLLMPGTKFMIHSEHTDDEFLIEAFRQGINAYLCKDSSTQQFLDTLRILHNGEDFIDPSLSKNVINIFRNEFTLEQKGLFSTEPFYGLLNSRESQVLRGLVKGKQYKEIAAELYISINTVRHYVKSIYKKLEVNNRTQLVQKVRR